MKKTALVLRILGALVLTYFVYKETGLATAAFALLMFLNTELNFYLKDLDYNYKDKVNDILDRIVKTIEK